MRRLVALILTGAVFSAPVFARDLIMGFPVDCTLGEDCFVLNLVDADPGKGAADFTCGPRSYDGHKGTDFALLSYQSMRDGVDVVAAAPGRVRGVRDGMIDKTYRPEDKAALGGRDCGNGMVVDHGGGWETQYCHLKQGSVTVKSGQAVRMGQVLGKIGLSGRTQYPHLHISVRKDGQRVDPFDPDGITTCGTRPPLDEQLWQVPIPYADGGIVTSGFAPELPEYDAIKQGTVTYPQMRADAPALVGWSFIYGPRKGDILRMRLEGPDGVVIEKDLELTKTQVLASRSIGRKTRTPWPPGRYSISTWLIRDGQVLDAHMSDVLVTP